MKKSIVLLTAVCFLISLSVSAGSLKKTDCKAKCAAEKTECQKAKTNCKVKCDAKNDECKKMKDCKAKCDAKKNECKAEKSCI